VRTPSLSIRTSWIEAAGAGTVIHFMDPITEKEKRQEAELEALCRKITAEDPGYFDRLVDRVQAEAKAEGMPMEEFLGMRPAEEGQ
jgi:hypothetical protein